MNKRATQFDFWFAVNNTEIVVSPKRHIETFGNTIINYHLVSELMDSVGKVRVREGRMQAMRPQIITPSSYATTMLEGFGEQAHKYMEWLKQHEDSIRILRYGYTLKQEAFSEQVVTDSTEAVLDRVRKELKDSKDPFRALVKGVDDPWDVCLVKLFWTVIQNSARSNIRELHEQNMFEMEDGIPVPLKEEVEKGFKAAAQDPGLIKELGRMLQRHGLFERYQDRFFELFRGRG